MSERRDLLRLLRKESDDLADINNQLARIEGKVDGLAETMRGFESSFQKVAADLPKIVGDAVRDALPKRRGKQ